MKKSYLHKNDEGKVQLMSNHSYYYQVQTQLLVTAFKFCDFFVWIEKDTFLETIRVDTEIQANILSNPSLYFAMFFYQNLLVNILQTQLTVLSHKINGAFVK